MKKQYQKMMAALTFSLLLLTISCQTSEDFSPDDFGEGVILNSPTALEQVPEADIDQENFKLPSKFSLAGPPIISQGKTGKCVAFSGAYYILSMYNGLNSSRTDNDISSSPEFAYAQYKKVNNDKDCNEGCFMFNEGGDKGLAEILKNFGTTTWNQMPFVNSSVCSLTNSTLVSQAEANKIPGYYRLDKNEYNNIKELKTWLYGGYPLWFAVNVEDNWDDIGTGVWSESSGKASPHAMVIVGYDDSRKALKIANSWGTDWGDNGFGWIGYSHFVELIEETQTVGVLMPNAGQRANLGKLSAGGCSKSGWGRITIENKRNEEVAVEIVGQNNYNNNNADNIDAKETQDYTGVPNGKITIKVFNKSKSALIREIQVTLTACDNAVVTVN